MSTFAYRRLDNWLESQMQVHKCLYIGCWNECQQTLLLINVSTYAHRTLDHIWTSCKVANNSPGQSKARCFEKKCSRRIFNESNWSAELKTSTQRNDRKRLVSPLQMRCMDIATQCLKQWKVYIIAVFVKRHKLP